MLSADVPGRVIADLVDPLVYGREHFKDNVAAPSPDPSNGLQLEVEPNNSAATAETVTVPVVDILTATAASWVEVPGTIGAADVDFYRVVLSARSGLFVDIDSRDIGLSTTLDSVVEVLSSTQNVLVTNDDGWDFEGFAAPTTSRFTPSSLDSSLYADLAAGTYFIRVTGGTGSQGDYRLRMLADNGYTTTVPTFSSLPGAADTLHIDFDGHSGNDAWGAYTAAAYDLNGSVAEFTPAERLAMRNTWATIAEDYSPFQLNVTTVAPPSLADGVAFKMVVTSSPSSIVNVSGALGVAFLNSYAGGGVGNQVAWTFSSVFDDFMFSGDGGISGLVMATPIEMGNTTSHEFGHALGLLHFSTNGSITASVIPSGIMATPDLGFNRESWGRGDADGGNNTIPQDDDAVISNATNTIGYRTDDHGGTIAAATSFVGTPIRGIIENIDLGDVDVFGFDGGGTATVRVDVEELVADLVPVLEIVNSSGTVVATSTAAGSVDAVLVVPLPVGRFFARVRSNGGDGQHGQYLFSVTFANRPPVVNSATAPDLPENSAAATPVFTATATDPDGDAFTWSITGGNTGGAFAIDPSTGQITVADQGEIDFETTPTFSLQVAATDNGSPSRAGTGTITINLTNVNEPGTKITLSPNSAQEGQPVGTVVGTISTDDPDVGDTFTFALVSGLGDANNVLFRVNGDKLETAQVLDFEGAPTLFVRLRATDSGSNSFEALFPIVVGNVNEAPTNIILNPLTSPAFGEDALAGTNLASFTATDSDIGDTAAFQLAAGTGDTDNGLFTISGGLLQLAGMLDFETKPTLSIRVRATDAGGAPFEKAFTLNVSNVNEAPGAPILSNSTVVEDVGGAVVGTLSAVDPDGAGPLFFTIASDLDGAQFTIVGNELRAGAAGIDFEAGATRQVRIRVADLGGFITSQTFTINVLNTNEELTISALAVPENSALGSVVGTFSTVGATGPFAYSFVTGDGSADNSLFSISGNQLLTNTALDFETRKTYSVRVRSTPTAGGPFDRVFTIVVTDQPEDPTAVLLSITSGAQENDPAGREVGTLSATDPDAGSSFSFALVSGIGADDNGSFTITGGNRLVSTAVFDREAKPVLSVRVRVTDNTGRTFEQVFPINVANVNEPPTNVSFGTGGSVPENVASFLVGDITSNDPDIGDNITFRLAPRDQSSGLKDDSFLFEIRNGNQVFTRTTPLDYEAGTSLVIWVRATDSANLFVETSVTVNVTDQNDAPTALSLNGGTVTENVTGLKSVGVLATSDPDAVDNFTYTLVPPATGSNDNALFALSGSQLVTTQTFNAEARSFYVVRVRSTDKGGQTIEKDFTIRVLNVNEAPTNITLSNASVSENRAVGTAVGTLAATDPEGDGPIYELAAGPGDASNGLFRIDGNVLRTAASLDFETASSHSIRVRARDINGASSERSFTITVIDDGAPTRFLRAYNRRGEYHFYTTQQSEFDLVVRQAGFRDETTNQSGFNVLGDLLTGATGIHRLYNFQTQRHYYTTNSAERDGLVAIVPQSNPNYGAVGWRYERDEGFIFPSQLPGTVPIHRLYNNLSGVHLYTESINQRDSILRQFPGIWESHGILGFGYPVVFVAAAPVPQAATAAPESRSAAAVVAASVSAEASSSLANGTRVDTLVAVPTSNSTTTDASASPVVEESAPTRRRVAVTTSPETSSLDDAFRLLATDGLDSVL